MAHNFLIRSPVHLLQLIDVLTSWKQISGAAASAPRPVLLSAVSAFALQDGAVYHTYSTYARGTEALMGTYQFLDLAPWGRNEEGLEFPQAWWRRHDEYGKQ